MFKDVRVLAPLRGTNGGAAGGLQVARDEDLVEPIGIQDVEPHLSSVRVDFSDAQARDDEHVPRGGLQHPCKDVLGHLKNADCHNTTSVMYNSLRAPLRRPALHKITS